MTKKPYPWRCKIWFRNGDYSNVGFKNKMSCIEYFEHIRKGDLVKHCYIEQKIYLC